MMKTITLNILSLLVWLIALHASATAQTLEELKQVSVANDDITRDNLNLTKDSDGKGTLLGIN